MHGGQTQSFLFGKPEILWIYNFGYQFCNSDGTGKCSKDISCQRPGFDFTQETNMNTPPLVWSPLVRFPLVRILEL